MLYFFVQAVSYHLTEDALGILLSLARFVNLEMKSYFNRAELSLKTFCATESTNIRGEKPRTLPISNQ